MTSQSDSGILIAATITLGDLAKAIEALPEADQSKPAIVVGFNGQIHQNFEVKALVTTAAQTGEGTPADTSTIIRGVAKGP